MRVTPLGISPLLLVATLGLTACGTRARENGASTVAERFVAAVSGRDGATACRLLTERGSTVGQVEVWGDAAQVRIGADVIFLLHLDSGWFVSAAGCTPRPSAPYQCDVDG
jgi:hypothetical protein